MRLSVLLGFSLFVGTLAQTVPQVMQNAGCDWDNNWGAVSCPSSVNLWGADLSDADLRHAQLQGVILQDVDLTGADLRYANLQYARLDDAILTNANLANANLQGANLEFAVLQNANLANADFTNAQFLTSANFGGSTGCTDPEAFNYVSVADNDDGSCIIEGCTDSNAIG